MARPVIVSIQIVVLKYHLPQTTEKEKNSRLLGEMALGSEHSQRGWSLVLSESQKALWAARASPKEPRELHLGKI
jgi:hypothetical protein